MNRKNVKRSIRKCKIVSQLDNPKGCASKRRLPERLPEGDYLEKKSSGPTKFIQGLRNFQKTFDKYPLFQFQVGGSTWQNNPISDPSTVCVMMASGPLKKTHQPKNHELSTLANPIIKTLDQGEKDPISMLIPADSEALPDILLKPENLPIPNWDLGINDIKKRSTKNIKEENILLKRLDELLSSRLSVYREVTDIKSRKKTKELKEYKKYLEDIMDKTNIELRYVLGEIIKTDVNQKNIRKETTMHIAARHGDNEMMRFLIEKLEKNEENLDMKSENFQGDTVLKVITDHCKTEQRETGKLPKHLKDAQVQCLIQSLSQGMAIAVDASNLELLRIIASGQYKDDIIGDQLIYDVKKLIGDYGIQLCQK